MDALEQLTDADLIAIASALRSGRLSAPFTPMSLQRYCPPPQSVLASVRLQQLHDEGMKPQHVALFVETIERMRRGEPHKADRVEVVWTGPDYPGANIRDTGVVVRELFGAAEDEVFVAGFAIHQGRSVFKRLADRMKERPSLRVKFFLNVFRDTGDSSSDDELLRRFVHRFQTHEWPEGRLPAIYYDPRSLDSDFSKRSSLHAKCITIDRRISFVTSANFTEAAQMRNIEVGALIRCERFSERLAGHFDALVENRILKPLDANTK